MMPSSNKLALAPIRVKPLNQQGFFGRAWSDFHTNQAIALQDLNRKKADTPANAAGQVVVVNATGDNIAGSNKKMPAGDLVGTEEKQTLNNKTLFQPDLRDANLSIQAQFAGRFTVQTGDHTIVVRSSAIRAGSVVLLTAANAGAAVLIAGTAAGAPKPYIDPADYVVNESFTVTITAGTVAGGEVFNYVIFNTGG